MEADRQFRAPESTLGSLNAEAAANLLAAATDVALVVDQEGVVCDLAFGNEELSEEGYGEWLGQPWAETVTVESRPKVEALLRDAVSETPARWRQVNHPSSKGPDVPILYSAVRIGEAGRVVAMGRDLRSMASLQQRLVEAQQSLERDYSRLRDAETRYRVLFKLATEAVLIVDVATLKISEANPAAAAVLNETADALVGRSFLRAFRTDDGQAVETMLGLAKAVGRADEVRGRLANNGTELRVSASMFRQHDSAHYLIRLASMTGDAPSHAAHKSQLLEAIEVAPDGFVVTSASGKVLTANRAFLDMAQTVSEEQARKESLSHWLGRTQIDFNVLMSNLRQHGAVRLFATTLRGEQGSEIEVEISAVAVPSSEQPLFGFTIRHVGRRLAGNTLGAALPSSADRLTDLVGRVTLKELVKETTDVIEKLCIEAALELTRDNRASAADILGLSRQSLYVKMRRHGLADGSDEERS